MTQAATKPPPQQGSRVGPRDRWVAAVGVLVAFASVPMALSGTTIAVPAIAAELDGGGFALSWIVTGYFLTASALMLVTGTLSDKVGRRRVFALGASCFGVGGLGSALAPSIVILDVFRTVAGVGSACLMAAGGAVLASVFTGRARARAFAAVGMMVGAGLALGPGLAGLVVGHLGWRALFGLLAVVALALLGAAFFMPESRGAPTRLDAVSTLCYVAGLTAAMVGVLQATEHGWVDPRVVVPVAAGVAALAVFVRRQSRLADPMLDVALLTNRHVAGWLLAALTLACGTLGALTHLPVFLQATGRFSPGAAGAVMLALTVPILILPPVSAAAVTKGVPPRAILAVAVTLIVSGNVALSRVPSETTVGFVAASLLVVGAANGLLTGLVDPQTLAQVPQHRLGMASGLLNTVRAAGNTATLAVFAALLVTQLQSRLGDRALAGRIVAGDLTSSDQLHPYGQSLQTALLIVAGVCAALGVAAILLTRPDRPTTDPPPKASP